MCMVLLCGHPVLCVCVWCCSVVIRCYVSVSGDVYGVALWSSGVMCL